MTTFNVQLDSAFVQAVTNVAHEGGYLDEYIQKAVEHRLEDVSTIINYTTDHMDAIAEQACDNEFSYAMIIAFIDAKPKVVANAVSYRDEAVFEALKELYEDDGDIQALFKNIAAFVNKPKESEE